MALTYKMGCFNSVLDELLKMKLAQKNVFLLFGQIDIIIQFAGLQNLEEFIKNWFDPIRKIASDNHMIEKTETFIVISEGKSFSEEPYAFLFINGQPPTLEKLQED